MSLNTQKKLAAKVANVGLGRVSLDTTRLDEIKEAITKADIAALIKKGAIKIFPASRPSRQRAKFRLAQKKKGKRKGHGTRRGARGARQGKKSLWVIKIRVLRGALQNLRAKKMISLETFHDAYAKAKGGFFRDRGHMMFYLNQSNLIIKDEK